MRAADFKAFITRFPHDVATTRADVRARQQCAVEKRGKAVVRDHRSPLHFSEETLAEHALDRATRVVGPKAKQKGCASLIFFEKADQRGHAEAGAVECIDVYLECEILFHIIGECVEEL